MSMLDYKELLTKNVHTIDNFATSDELSAILKKCNEFTNWDNTWQEYVPGERFTERPDCGERVLVSSRALSIVSATVGRRLCFLYEPYLRKYTPGSYLKMHADAEGYYGDVPQPLKNYNPNNPTSEVLNEYSSILYLNDEFDGGELYFEEIDLLVKPKANQLVFFPSGAEFRHEVKPIVNGDRYTLASFYTTDKLIGMHERIRNMA
jgi:predicted 2-oxoglutarate/Fe(II)-dependent dioxygenase YbiX